MKGKTIMPFDSEGTFTRIHNWEDDRINGISIDSDRMDEEHDDIANGLSRTLLRDGRIGMTGNLNMTQFQIRNIADGTSQGDAVNKGQMDASISTSIASGLSSTVFIGDIKMSMQTANHGNWLICNGQAVNRTEYADLFAVIGTTFGTGNGTTTFNVPNFSGRVGQMKTSSQTLGQTIEAGLPNITGSKYGIAMEDSDTQSGALYRSGVQSNTGFIYDGTGDYKQRATLNFNASRSSSVYGKSSTVQPPAIAVNYFIKAKNE